MIKIINKIYNLKGIILTIVLITLSILFEYIKRVVFKHSGIYDISTYSNMGHISIKNNFLIKTGVSIILFIINLIAIKYS